MIRYLGPLIAFLLLVPIFMVGLTRDPTEVPSPFIGKPAPEFTLPSLTEPDQIVGSSDFAGDYALVNVWATWCVGCRQEHDFLKELKDVQPIPIIGLNWRDNRPDAMRWLRTLGDPYEFTAYDEDGRVGIDWGVYGAPETFLLNSEGIVLYKHLGPLDREIWEREFVSRIEENQ